MYKASITCPSCRTVLMPLLYITVAIQAKTPMGVKSIIFETIKMEISWMEVHSFTKGSAFSFRERQASPIMMEKEST